jgi:hypothetical protein
LADESTAGDVYADVIDELLELERGRKASLEQKALSVITSSGVLVTLLFGFASLTKSTQSTGLPVLARAFLVAGMASFLVAILDSLRINRPVNYSPLGVKKDLQRMLTDDLWFDAAAVGRRAIAEFRVGEIDRWREENGHKARRLQRAIIAESAGVALLAVSVGVLLFRGYPG